EPVIHFLQYIWKRIRIEIWNLIRRELANNRYRRVGVHCAIRSVRQIPESDSRKWSRGRWSSSSHAPLEFLEGYCADAGDAGPHLLITVQKCARIPARFGLGDVLVVWVYLG